VGSEIEIMVDNPVFTYNLAKEKLKLVRTWEKCEEMQTTFINL
jgi:hypothetical protein